MSNLDSISNRSSTLQNQTLIIRSWTAPWEIPGARMKTKSYNLMPFNFSQQKGNWTHAACLSALCALWQGYWRLQYGLCLQMYEVYAKYPEVLYSVSNLSDLNCLSNPSKWYNNLIRFEDSMQICLASDHRKRGQAKWSIRVCKRIYLSNLSKLSISNPSNLFISK